MKVVDGHKRENIHFKWTKNLKPIEYIDSNETFRIKIPDSSTDQIKEYFTDDDAFHFYNRLEFKYIWF